jgi:hypothetical protein
MCSCTEDQLLGQSNTLEGQTAFGFDSRQAAASVYSVQAAKVRFTA